VENNISVTADSGDMSCYNIEDVEGDDQPARRSELTSSFLLETSIFEDCDDDEDEDYSEDADEEDEGDSDDDDDTSYFSSSTDIGTGDENPFDPEERKERFIQLTNTTTSTLEYPEANPSSPLTPPTSAIDKVNAQGGNHDSNYANHKPKVLAITLPEVPRIPQISELAVKDGFSENEECGEHQEGLDGPLSDSMLLLAPLPREYTPISENFLLWTFQNAHTTPQISKLAEAIFPRAVR
jgi:hypothetical protein